MKLTRENLKTSKDGNYGIFAYGHLLSVFYSDNDSVIEHNGKRITHGAFVGENIEYDFFPASEIKMPEDVLGSPKHPIDDLNGRVNNLAEILQGQIVAGGKLRGDVDDLMKHVHFHIPPGKYKINIPSTWSAINTPSYEKPETDARDFTSMSDKEAREKRNRDMSNANKPERTERILCAAIRYQYNGLDSKVICGFDYSHIFLLSNHLERLTGQTKGFLTTRNRFVTNPEAWNIARKANQIGDKYFEDFIAVLEPKDLL